MTVNTLLKDRELPDALDFVEYLCSLPVDAVLVQDMGLFSLLRQWAPALPVHASTQMSLHTPGGVKLLWELGASRVVLSRELSLEEIREIRRACPVELESFVHGALCMSVSGQCYLSALLGGRSGNRGSCAQPCRLPFAAPGGTGHDLSLKDLSFVQEVGQLKEAGVCSAKIEGRMKRPEYVAAAVSACRRAADGEQVPQQLLDGLEAVFSRSGFTKGYLTGQRGREMFGTRTKEDVTGATEKVFSSLRNLYRGEMQRVSVFLDLEIQGAELRLSARDGEGHRAVSAAPPGGGPFFAAPGAVRAAAEKDGGHAFPGGGRVRAGRGRSLWSLCAERTAPGGLGAASAPAGAARPHSVFQRGAVFLPPPQGHGGAAPARPFPKGLSSVRAGKGLPGNCAAPGNAA